MIKKTSEKPAATASGSFSATLDNVNSGGHGFPKRVARLFSKNERRWCEVLCDTVDREYDTVRRYVNRSMDGAMDSTSYNISAGGREAERSVPLRP